MKHQPRGPVLILVPTTVSAETLLQRVAKFRARLSASGRGVLVLLPKRRTRERNDAVLAACADITFDTIAIVPAGW